MADLHTNIESLKQACQNPRAQLDKYLAEGKKVIGCFEPYTPEELVHASGMIPPLGWPDRLKACKKLPATFCLPHHAGQPGTWPERHLQRTQRCHNPGNLRHTALYDSELALWRS